MAAADPVVRQTPSPIQSPTTGEGGGGGSGSPLAVAAGAPAPALTAEASHAGHIEMATAWTVEQAAKVWAAVTTVFLHTFYETKMENHINAKGFTYGTNFSWANKDIEVLKANQDGNVVVEYVAKPTGKIGKTIVFGFGDIVTYLADLTVFNITRLLGNVLVLGVQAVMWGSSQIKEGVVSTSNTVSGWVSSEQAPVVNAPPVQANAPAAESSSTLVASSATTETLATATTEQPTVEVRA